MAEERYSLELGLSLIQRATLRESRKEDESQNTDLTREELEKLANDVLISPEIMGEVLDEYHGIDGLAHHRMFGTPTEGEMNYRGSGIIFDIFSDWMTHSLSSLRNRFPEYEFELSSQRCLRNVNGRLHEFRLYSEGENEWRGLAYNSMRFEFGIVRFQTSSFWKIRKDIKTMSRVNLECDKHSIDSYIKGFCDKIGFTGTVLSFHPDFSLIGGPLIDELVERNNLEPDKIERKYSTVG